MTLRLVPKDLWGTPWVVGQKEETESKGGGTAAVEDVDRSYILLERGDKKWLYNILICCKYHKQN